MSLPRDCINSTADIFPVKSCGYFVFILQHCKSSAEPGHPLQKNVQYNASYSCLVTPSKRTVSWPREVLLSLSLIIALIAFFSSSKHSGNNGSLSSASSRSVLSNTLPAGAGATNTSRVSGSTDTTRVLTRSPFSQFESALRRQPRCSDLVPNEGLILLR